MKCHYIKFHNNLNYQIISEVYDIKAYTAKNLIENEWEDYLDLNDFIKKI